MKSGQEPWYRTFFGQGYLDTYDFDAERTLRQVDFIEEVLALPRGGRILDLCCGHGRHLVELAARGYEMIGLDLDELFLGLAREELEKRNLTARLIHADMREIPARLEVDAVTNLFTAFGYFEDDEEDLKVLRGVAGALKPGGKFLLDTVNRELLVRVFQPRGWHQTSSGVRVLEKRSFDLLNGRTQNEILRIAPDGEEERVRNSLRVYTLIELAKMLRRVGLEVRETYGGIDKSTYGLDSRRMMILAQKEAC